MYHVVVHDDGDHYYDDCSRGDGDRHFFKSLTYAVVEVCSFLHLALNLAPGIYIQIHNSRVGGFTLKFLD